MRELMCSGALCPHGVVGAMAEFLKEDKKQILDWLMSVPRIRDYLTGETTTQAE